MAKYRITLQILFLLFMSGCELFKSADKTDQLPPATQEGKNTFGCLVNGKVWLPKGNNGTANLDASYDPNFQGASIFDLSAYKINTDIDRQYFYLFATNVTTGGSYDLSSVQLGTITFDYSYESSTDCNYNRDSVVFRTGTLTISKFDLGQGIISGKFLGVLARPNCDTLKITEGRFDMKFN